MQRLSRLVALQVLVAASMIRADVKLPAIIGDNMALQQGVSVPIWGWAEPGEEVTVSIAGQSKTAKAGDNKKWMVKLDPLKPGEPLEMTVKGKNTLTLKNILVGEVWVCSGQSNMGFSLNRANNAPAEKAAANFPKIRLFTVKRAVQTQPQDDCSGTWVECSPDTVGSFSAVAYFFGRHLHKELNVPVGLIHTSVGGTPAESWTSGRVLQAEPDFKPILDRFEKAKQDDTPENFAKRQDRHKAALEKWKADAAQAKADGKEFKRAQPRAPEHALNTKAPSVLYNGMVAPIIPFAIAGATWYQGEANAGRAMQYRKLLPAMIADWRKAWGQGDFTFMIVQLANYQERRPDPGDSAWAELREAQTLTSINVPKSGLSLTIDIGEADDIHPKNKQDAGMRLALQALKIHYNKDIPFAGPMYDSMSVDGASIRIKFKHVYGGLQAKEIKDAKDAKPGELRGFAIAGEDQKFVWATAKIDGDTVVVSTDKVAKPVAVRYAWADNPECNLYNKADLPAVPFRTDTWKGVTDGKN